MAAGIKKEDYNPKDYLEEFGTNSMCLESTLLDSTLAYLPQPRGSCYRASCGTDNRLRVTIKNVTTLCEREGQKIRVSGVKGYAICPNPIAACAAQQNKEIRINVLSAMPDRGPRDGQNLVSLKGFGLSNYTKDDLTIKFGKVPCDIIYIEDESILCQVQNPSTIPDLNIESILTVPQIGHISSKAAGLDTDVENLYTFVNQYYN